MEFISQFNLQRLGYLLVRDIKQYWKTYALLAGVFAGIILATSLIYAYDQDNDLYTVHLNFFPAGILMGGFYLTSIIFRELANPIERAFYLSVPASNLEKFISKLLISNVAFIFVTILFYIIFSYINNGIVYLLTNLEINNFQPFSETNWEVIKVYAIVQSIFLLGAVTFPKYSFPKTLLAFIVIMLLIGAAWFLVFRVSFADQFNGFSLIADADNVNGIRYAERGINGIGTTFFTIIKIVIAPALWVVSYFKLSEKEV